MTTALPIALALLAAALFAAAAAAEQRAAAQVAARVRMPSSVRNCVGVCGGGPEQHRPPVRDGAARFVAMARELLNHPLWVAGWAVDAVGFLVQAAALHYGSLSFVQPLLVTTLLFSMPLAAWGSRLRVRPVEWSAAVAICLGLILVLAGRGDAGAAGHHRHVLAAVAAAVFFVIALLLVARRTRGAARAALLSVAAATLFSIGAVCTKLVAGLLVRHGLVGVLASWPPYVLILASGLGLILQQQAFTVGSLGVSMTAVTITDPLVSYLIGIIGFGESGPAGFVAIAAAALGVLMLAAGVVVLAWSPLVGSATGAETVEAPRREVPEVGGGRRISETGDVRDVHHEAGKARELHEAGREGPVRQITLPDARSAAAVTRTEV